MVKTLIAVLLFSISIHINGQTISYNYFYRITFTEKKKTVTDYQPEQLLSQRAIARREKAGIDLIDYRDIPVDSEDIKMLTGFGLILHSSSRWMNSALMKSVEDIDLMQLSNLPNVAEARLVKSPGSKNVNTEKLNFVLSESLISQYDRPVTMLNGYALHDQGFRGRGILIAVLDGGFYNADEITSLEKLRNRGGIKATRDFVQNKESVYSSHNHGTAVLSVLAGKLPLEIEGTAPEADYLLLKTEDVNSEYPCEEDYWAAGAEFADSSGADIITSSLGYTTFDDPSMNYVPADLDGNKSFITRVADIAALKGIMVFNSAGNERINSWQKIICPADGKNVTAVGAVDSNKKVSSFSSEGPSYDRRIKPDFMALGVNVPLQTSTSIVGTASGTSFSCPVLSGMTACLIQAVPEAANKDILKALRESADNFTTPDSLYGFGIPDMGRALLKLQDVFLKVPDQISVAGPNPTTGQFNIIFRESYESVITEIFTSSGKLISKKEINTFAGRKLTINELVNREQGLYIIRITTPTASSVHKIIKIKN